MLCSVPSPIDSLGVVLIGRQVYVSLAQRKLIVLDFILAFESPVKIFLIDISNPLWTTLGYKLIDRKIMSKCSHRFNIGLPYS